MPNKVLIVEDDPFKFDKIAACLTSRLGSNSIDIVTATSVQAAVDALAARSYKLILLDISLPSHDIKPGGAPAGNLLSGGIEVLMELSYMSRSDPVIIITQYPEIEIEGELIPLKNASDRISEILSVQLKGVVLYDHEALTWENQVAKILGIAL